MKLFTFFKNKAYMKPSYLVTGKSRQPFDNDPKAVNHQLSDYIISDSYIAI